MTLFRSKHGKIKQKSIQQQQPAKQPSISN